MSYSAKEQKLAKKSHNIHFSKKWIIIVASAVLVGAIISYLLYFYNQNPKVDVQTSLEKAKVMDANYSDALKKSLSGDYAGSQKSLDNTIVESIGKSDEAWIYIQKSSIALNALKYDDAYNFANKAEELFPTVSSVKLMAAAADAKGNKDEAIQKYKLALSRIAGDSDLDKLDKNDLINIIKELGGSV